MKLRISLLLTFAICAFHPPPTCYAHGEVTAKSETAKRLPEPTYCEPIAYTCNEMFAIETIVLTSGFGQDAPNKELAIPKTTPTVEVKAIAAVAVHRYQRVKPSDSYILKIRPVPFSNQIVHIDPGLRGC